MIRTILPPCHPFGFVSQSGIKVKGKENVIIEFPAVLKEISGTIKNLIADYSDYPVEEMIIPLPAISTATLLTLQDIVHQLTATPGVARDLNGNPATSIVNVYQVSENPQTILVNQLVQDTIAPVIQTLPDEQLLDLLKATNYLRIPSLTNAAAFFTANMLFESVLEETDLHLADDDFIIESVIDVLPPLDRELAIRIAKYIYLKIHGLREKTIADYIGMNGIPGVVDRGLKISHKGITGLSGMELISNNEVFKADLSNNTILGNSLDPNFPPSPFSGLRNLQGLYLNNNHLTTLSESVFSELRNLKELYLGSNQLTRLPERIFSGLGNLQGLYLNNNHLITLPKDVFSGLGNLRWLRLNNNHLTTLPKGVFSGLGNLLSLYLDNNRLSGTKTEFINRHFTPGHEVSLEFDRQHPPLSASMRYSPRYSNPCACFQKPVSPYYLFHPHY